MRGNGNAFLLGLASSIILHLKLPIIVTAHTSVGDDILDNSLDRSFIYDSDSHKVVCK